MKNKVLDVAIIGAGVTGASIARKLSAYKLDIALIEKETDVAFGVSKANSGIIHAGFHHPPVTLKSKLEIMGNSMFDQLNRELHFPFKRCGIIVAAMSVEEMKTIQELYQRGVNNGVIGIELCNRSRMLELEPNLNSDVTGGLYAPTGGIIEPYRFVFSLVESARKNGVNIITNFEVVDKRETNNTYTLISSTGESIKARYVINASGLYADKISELFGAKKFKITPRKGEYYLLDKSSSYRPSRVIFPVPTKISKGILVVPTVEGTTLIGPTAENINDREDFSTSIENFEKIFYATRRLVPAISERDIITSFAGVRPAAEGGDFIIESYPDVPKFINAAGIQSPGLTASPAIAEYVKDLLKKQGCRLVEKPDYDPYLDETVKLREMDHSSADQLFQKDPRYGNIICRCENVSEAEIVHAIHQGHTTLDGIKFYTRAQMGRCQGGFCSYKIIKIIHRETGLPFEKITKRGRESYILKGSIEDDWKGVVEVTNTSLQGGTTRDMQTGSPDNNAQSAGGNEGNT